MDGPDLRDPRFNLWLYPRNFSGSIGSGGGPGSSSGKALGYGLDGPGSIPGDGGVEIFLRSFMSRLVLRSTQPPIK